MDLPPASRKSPVEPPFLVRHRPALLVLASQAAAASLHGIVKLIETGMQPVHPFTVLQIRLLIVGLASTAILWHRGQPHFPLGPPALRPLLLVRAVGGVCGAVGFYFSIVYLTLSEATALNFLGPLGALILARLQDYGRFGWVEGSGAALAFTGVMFVVQPEVLFGDKRRQMPVETRTDWKGEAIGLSFGVLGVVGGVIALTAVRRLGTRVQPLVSVNYFAWANVIVTTVGSLILPQVHWPRSSLTWLYLVSVGVIGFIMESLLTAGISSDISAAATMMIYSQVLWALALDTIFWHVKINLWAVIGIAAVIGSLLMVSFANDPRVQKLFDNLKFDMDEGPYHVALDTFDDDDLQEEPTP